MSSPGAAAFTHLCEQTGNCFKLLQSGFKLALRGDILVVEGRVGYVQLPQRHGKIGWGGGYVLERWPSCEALGLTLGSEIK